MNHTAIGSDGLRALTRHVQSRCGSGCQQARAFAHNDKAVESLDLRRSLLVLAANFDTATIEHFAVALTLGIDSRHGFARHIQHGIAAQPDRTIVSFEVAHVLATSTQTIDTDLAARGSQGAIHRNLTAALQ